MSLICRHLHTNEYINPHTVLPTVIERPIKQIRFDMKKMILAVAVAAAMVMGQNPTAQAREFGGSHGWSHGGWHGGGGNDGFGIAAGVIGGLVLGAALSSSSHECYSAPAPTYSYYPQSYTVYSTPAPAPVYTVPNAQVVPMAPTVVYQAPAPVVYYQPAPVYYSAPSVSIGIGFGGGWGRPAYCGGHRGYYRGRW
jgi:hypothetical protein